MLAMRKIGFSLLSVFLLSITACGGDDSGGASASDSGACQGAGCDGGKDVAVGNADGGVLLFPDAVVPRLDGAVDAKAADGGPQEAGPCQPGAAKQNDHEIVYEAQHRVRCIAVDQTGAYWSEDNSGVYHLAPNASKAEQVYAGTDYRMDMMVNGEWLYISETDQTAKTLRLLRVPEGDLTASPQDVFAEFGLPGYENYGDACVLSFFAMDADNAYFAIPGDPNIYQAPLAGGSPVVLVADAGAQGVYLNGDYLYYANDKGEYNRPAIWRVPVTGGEPEQVVYSFDSFEMGDMIIVGDYFFWSDGAGLNKRSLDNPGASTVLSRTDWLENEIGYATLEQLTLIDDRLYWDDADLIGWTSLDGKSCGYADESSFDIFSEVQATAWAVSKTELYIAFDDFFGDVKYGVWRIKL